MAEPIEYRTLGGLTYNHNMVTDVKKLDDVKYEIIFKTGEKLTYPEQKDFSTTVPRNAKVEVRVDEGILVDDSSFYITNVMGATFTTSKDARAAVVLDNSSDCTIDLASNESSYYPDTATLKDGARNLVILDDQDIAIINDVTIEGRGNAAQKDY